MDVIEPDSNDHVTAMPEETLVVDEGQNVINLDETTGWQQPVSPTGSFKIYAPTLPGSFNDFPLRDWSLELSGLPRMYHLLQRLAIVSAFGEVTASIIDNVYAYTQHESLGDLLALRRSQGTLDFAAVRQQTGQMPLVTIELDDDLNQITQEGRAGLVAQAYCPDAVYSGRLVLAKGVIIGNNE